MDVKKSKLSLGEYQLEPEERKYSNNLEEHMHRELSGQINFGNINFKALLL